MNSNFKSILFLGVGGVSMHQLAICFKEMGFSVLGYDSKESNYTKQCKAKGISITHRYDKDFLNVDLCVRTGAIKENNRWVKALKNLNVPIVDRAEILGWLSSKFKQVIAVAGTHGKSTTASLIYEILRMSGRSVSCHIGADVFAPRFNITDEFLVVEACEYNKSFLSLFPTISVITNVEPEHLDSYGNFFNLKNAFLTFAKRAKKRFVMNEPSTKFLNKLKNVEKVEIETNLNTKLKGEHNLKNLSIAVAVTKFLGVKKEIIQEVIQNFKGIPRRYELIGKVASTKVYIDYAHHPTEVNAFITAFKKEYKNSLIVFQPHTYSRTKNLFKDFIEVLKNVENLIIYKEYPARENKAQGYSAFQLFKYIQQINNLVEYCSNANNVIKKIQEFDAVAFVGAGDINLVAEKIVKRNL